MNYVTITGRKPVVTWKIPCTSPVVHRIVYGDYVITIERCMYIFRRIKILREMINKRPYMKEIFPRQKCKACQSMCEEGWIGEKGLCIHGRERHRCMICFRDVLCNTC